jgi:hypothetical protein
MRMGNGQNFSPGNGGSGWSFPGSCFLQNTIFVETLGYEGGLLLTPLSAPGTRGSGWSSYPHPCCLRNIVFVKILRYEGGHWPDLLPKTGGSDWSFPHSCYLQNTLFVKHSCMRVGIGRIFPPGTSGSEWSFPPSCYLHKHNIFITLMYESGL